jgi:hypothetical protein
MVSNALRGYLQLANGLSEVTKQRANEAARALSAQFGIQGEDAIAGATAAAGMAGQQVQALAEDLIATARANRRLLTELVRVEVERGVSRLGLVEQAQLESLRSVVSRLEEEVAAVIGVRRPSSTTAPATKSARSGARPLKKATAKKAAPDKTAAKKTAAKKSPAKKAPAQKATAKKTAAKKATTKATAAKTTAAKTTAAKTAAPQGVGS